MTPEQRMEFLRFIVDERAEVLAQTEPAPMPVVVLGYKWGCA